MSAPADPDPWAGAPALALRVRCGGADHLLRWERGRLLAPDHDVEAELALATLGDGGRPACVEIVAAWVEALALGHGPPRVLDRLADHLRGVSPGALVDVLDVDVEAWAARRREELRLAEPRFATARAAGRAPGRSPTPDDLARRVAANERAVFLRGLLLLLPRPFLAALAATASVAGAGTLGAGDVERLVAEAVVRGGLGLRVRCEADAVAPRLDDGTVVVGERWLVDVWFKGAALVGTAPCLALAVESGGTSGRAVLLVEDGRLLVRRSRLAEAAVVADGRGAWWVAGR